MGTQPPALPKWHSPQFLANICCGRMAGWIKMSLGKKVGLSPSDIVLDGDQALLPQRGRSPPICGPCLLLTNGWMDEDATLYGSRPQPRPHCVRRGPNSSPRERGTAVPPLSALVYCGYGRPSQLLLSSFLFCNEPVTYSLLLEKGDFWSVSRPCTPDGPVTVAYTAQTLTARGLRG